MKTAEENIIDTLKGKKILFLENDTELPDNGPMELKELLNRNKIKSKELLDIDQLPLTKIQKAIDKTDVIIYQTQWVYEIASTLKKYILSLTTPKIIIECYISEPTFYYQLDGIPHSMYIFKKDYENGRGAKFYKLSDEPYWNYENKFDK